MTLTDEITVDRKWPNYIIDDYVDGEKYIKKILYDEMVAALKEIERKSKVYPRSGMTLGIIAREALSKAGVES